jgi:hypothetical protein
MRIEYILILIIQRSSGFWQLIFTVVWCRIIFGLCLRWNNVSQVTSERGAGDISGTFVFLLQMKMCGVFCKFPYGYLELTGFRGVSY